MCVKTETAVQPCGGPTARNRTELLQAETPLAKFLYLFLYRAGGKSPDNIPLPQQIYNDHRKTGQNDIRKNIVPAVQQTG